MIGVGLGFGTFASLVRGVQSTASETIPAFAEPSAAWDGTEGSGFTDAPIDPARITAKPACRLLVPDRQWFTDELLVGVAAMANDGGTLFDNLGLEKVRAYFENDAPVDILAPSSPIFDDANGNPVSYPGWWVRLKKPAATAGFAQVYFEAVPRDATMQSRVIGPFTFAPQDVMHDVEVTVEPSLPELDNVGGIRRYQTLFEAQKRANQSCAQNPLITVKEPLKESLRDQFTNGWTIKGYRTITGDVPFTIAKPSRDYNDAVMDPNRVPIHLRGSNCTVDFAHVSTLNVAAGNFTQHWLDGINITNSAGRDGLWRGGPPQPSGKLVVGNPWITECQIANVHVPLRGVSLARGNTASSIAQDIISGSYCVVGNVIADHNNDNWNSDIPAFSVTYTGSEATATLSRSGGTEGYLGGVYSATYGATTATFDVGNGSLDHFNGTNGDGYWFADVVSWLNSLPGWSATLSPEMLAEDRRACTGALVDDRGQGFDGASGRAVPVNVKDSTATIYSHHDKHGDWYQHEAGSIENIVVMNNMLVDAQVQFIFLSPIGNGHEYDVVFINNIAVLNPSDGAPQTGASQLGRTNVEMSHVVLAHNTLVDQQIWMRTDNSVVEFDAYCLLANNVSPEIEWLGAVDSDFVVSGNHLLAGASDPQGAIGTSIGGNDTNLFADISVGDASPAGALTSNTAPPAVPFDYAGNPRAVPSAKGAIT